MATQKNLALEGLRGLASLAVVVGHFTFVFFGYLGTLWRPVAGAKPTYLFERVIEIPPITLIYSADAAVSVFFVMSGYVLTTKYFTSGSVQDLQSAAAKRYIRLVLPSFASILFAWLLWRSGAILTSEAARIGAAGWVPAWYQEPFTAWEAVVNGLVSAPLFGKAALNPPLWSIQVELIGSMLLFAMLALFGNRGPLLLFGWFLFFANVLGYASPNILYYLSFLAGALLNPAVSWLRERQAVSLCFFGLGLVGVGYCESSVFDPLRALSLPNLQPLWPNFNATPRIFWHSFGSVMLVAGTLGSVSIGRLLSARPLLFLGRVSFAMYLIHMPLLMSLALWVSRQAQKSGFAYDTSAGLAFLAYIPCVLVLSSAFQRWVDAPSIQLANSAGTWFRPVRPSNNAARA